MFLALVLLATCDWIAGLGNDAPVATTAIHDRIVEVDDTVALDLGLHFSDPDGDSLTYSVVSARPGRRGAATAATRRHAVAHGRGRGPGGGHGNRPRP